MSVPIWGVGRPDYSQNVEFATEPITRSAETPYTYNFSSTIGAGSSTIANVSVGSNVVFLYDFKASCDANVLMQMQIRSVASDGTTTVVSSEQGYQNCEYHSTKGYPFGNVVRVTLINRGPNAQNFEFYMAGLYTDETRYYLRGVEYNIETGQVPQPA